MAKDDANIGEDLSKDESSMDILFFFFPRMYIDME